jgi:hypothetical protein
VVTVRAKDPDTNVLSAFSETVRFTVPTDSTIPGTLQGLTLHASFANVLFRFNNGTDNDLATYQYELYEEDDIVAPNTPPYALVGGATPHRSGSGNSSVFAVQVDGSFIDENGDVEQRNFFGRVRAVDTSGNPGNWTAIAKTDLSTPLIDSQYIVSLTADKIKAGEIESAAIVLGGANPTSTIIKSKTYDTSSGSQGWFIRGDGTASIGGTDGINYIPGVGITLGSNVTIDGSVEVNANEVEVNGSTASQILRISESLDGGNSGLAIGTGGNNYWYTNGNFSVGDANSYVRWNGSSLSITGSITATSGTFTGTVSGSTITGGSININSGTFQVSSSGALTASSASITGTVNATSGSFSGTISAGYDLTTQFGNNINGASNYSGIKIGNTGWNNAWVQRSDGTVYFRASSNSSYLYMDTSDAYIGMGWDGGQYRFRVDNSGNLVANSATISGQINASSGNFSGNISSSATITGGTLSGSTISGGSILIGNSTSSGYISVASATTMIVNGIKFQNRQYAGWAASFYPYYDAQYDLSVVTSPTLGVYRWDNIYYIGSIVDQSDQRSKNSIETSDLGLNFINMLRPVSYFKNISKKQHLLDENENPIRDENENMLYDIIPGKRKHYGLIAQEVRQVIDDLGKTALDFSGWGMHDPEDPDSEQTLSYIEFISPIIKAIQELSLKIDQLEARMV